MLYEELVCGDICSFLIVLDSQPCAPPDRLPPCIKLSRCLPTAGPGYVSSDISGQNVWFLVWFGCIHTAQTLDAWLWQPAELQFASVVLLYLY